MPPTAWVPTKGKQPRLLRNSGLAFVPNPPKHGPCRPSRRKEYVVYKPARRTGPCLLFLNIEQPNAPQDEMFREDVKIGLPKKLIQKEGRRRHRSQEEEP